MRTLKIIAYKAPFASALYRVEQIAKYLNRTGAYEFLISPNTVTDRECQWADVIYVQGVVDPRCIADLWAYKMERGKTIIVDRDDLMQVLDDNPLKPIHERLNAVAWTQELLKIADRVIVTTETIAQEVKPLNSNVTVLPNYLDMELWERPLEPNTTTTLRIGFQGSITHRADLASILPVIKDVLQAHPEVTFVLCGDSSLTKELSDVPHRQWEFVDGIANYYLWPHKVYALSLDLGLAPLLDTPFNRARSSLKYLEYGMAGAPGIYSPVAYAGVLQEGKTGLLAQTPEQWRHALETLITDKALRTLIRKEARRDIRRHHDIGNHIDRWDRLIRQTVQGSDRAISSR